MFVHPQDAATPKTGVTEATPSPSVAKATPVPSVSHPPPVSSVSHQDDSVTPTITADFSSPYYFSHKYELHMSGVSYIVPISINPDLLFKNINDAKTYISDLSD